MALVADLTCDGCIAVPPLPRVVPAARFINVKLGAMHEKLWFGKHAHDMLVFVKVRPVVRTGDPGQTGRLIREGWAAGPGFQRGRGVIVRAQHLRDPCGVVPGCLHPAGSGIGRNACRAGLKGALRW